MIRRGWSIGLVLVVLSALLVAVPLAAPLARAGPSADVVFADEGDENDENDDDEEEEEPGKIAIYWPGRTIYFADDPDGYNGDPEEVAQEVLDRGFTHVVNRSYTMDDPKAAWFSERGFKVIQDVTPTGDLQPMTPRYHSPYEDPDTYCRIKRHLREQLDGLHDHSQMRRTLDPPVPGQTRYVPVLPLAACRASTWALSDSATDS